MLVLSRQTEDTIKFPELDITIEILQVKGSSVRVGIEAPVEIRILRGELVSADDPKVAQKFLVDADDAHQMRNALNTLTVAVGLTKKLLSHGKANQAAAVLHDALSRLGKDSVSENAACSSAVDVSGIRALLIEDAANEREMLAGFLRLHGYAVDTVGDGIEAIEFLEENEKPDVLLVDMNLPRLDGASVINQIRSNPAFDQIQIFAISGQTPKSAGVDMEKNRVADWFQKPLKPAGLVKAIGRHVAMSGVNVVATTACQ